MTFADPFARGPRSDPLSQTGFSMASTCMAVLWVLPHFSPSLTLSFSLSLSHALKRVFCTLTRSNDYLYTRASLFARYTCAYVNVISHIVLYRNSPYRGIEKGKKREREKERERESVCVCVCERERERKRERRKRGELSKLSRLSPRLSFRSWLKQSQRFSVEKMFVMKGRVKPCRVHAENSMIDNAWITSYTLCG